MKKIMWGILLFLALSNGANVAASSTASYAMARDGELWSREELRALVVTHLGGRSLEAFKAEVVGSVTETDLLLMAGSVLASQVATCPEKFPSVEFKKGTDLVSSWITEKGVPSFLAGCTIVDILRPRALPEDGRSPFPNLVGITFDTHIPAIGKITCFGHSAFATIRDSVVAHAAVHIDGDIDAVVAEARERLAHQLRNDGLSPEASLLRLGIPLTGNILGDDPEGLMFMAKSWIASFINTMDYFMRKNGPQAVCGPFAMQEIIRALQQMGGAPAAMANAMTHVTSYNAPGASNALLSKVKEMLNGVNENAFVLVMVDNSAPVGEVLLKFRAYGRKNSLFQSGPRWGDTLVLPDAAIDFPAEVEVASAGAGGAAACMTATDMHASFGPFQSAVSLAEDDISLGMAYAALNPSGMAVAAVGAGAATTNAKEQEYAPGAAKPDMYASYVAPSDAPLISAGAGASAVVAPPVTSLDHAIHWLTTTGPGAAILEALQARGYVAPPPPKPLAALAPGDPMGNLRFEALKESVLGTHDPEKLLWDLAIAYAVQKWSDYFKGDAAALRLESALRAVAGGK